MVLVLESRRRRHPGEVFLFFLALYCPSRFVLEYFRDTSIVLFALSSAQIVVLVMWSTSLLLLTTRRPRPETVATSGTTRPCPQLR